MKLIAELKLLPTAEHAAMLQVTLEQCNTACDWISQQAWLTRTFRQFNLHHITYYDVRKRFALSAQVTVRCIAKVADAYKLDRGTMRQFRPTSGQPYDHQILSFKGDTVSIWTLGGRLHIPFTCGQHQRDLLAHRQGEVDLILRRGEWYLMTTCEIVESPLAVCDDAIGVDLGIVNLAVDNMGTFYSGESLEEKRRIYTHRRRNLQRKGTHSARRKLKKIAGRQARYQKDVNHCISKAIVQTAERTRSVISLEDLRGIRKRVRVRRRQRARMSNWGFAQLRSFVEYKARRLGIPVLLIDPRNTSRGCPKCGHVAKANRPTRDRFQCICCGLAGPADHIAARNIRARAYVNGPMVVGTHQCADLLATSL